MKRLAAFLASIFLLCLALPAAAQTAKRDQGTSNAAREAAMKRCKENRGSDCESAEGLKEWLREDRPITPEEQKAAAGARRQREECAKNPKGGGC